MITGGTESVLTAVFGEFTLLVSSFLTLGGLDIGF
jgi:hypothetical protein